MPRLSIIKEQISATKTQTDKLVSKIATTDWFTTPDIINTNLNWQIGHIIVANYLHGVASIIGVSEAVRAKVNVPQFVKFYGPKSVPAEHQEDKPSREELLEIYEFIFDMIDESISQLTDADLDADTAIPNPNTTVKTKYDALMLLFKHQSWHNGQIAMLKRVLDVS